MIQVVLPPNLRILAGVGRVVEVEVPEPPTQRAVLDALEVKLPALLGTIRDATTKRRRPMIRFYACEEDLSDESPDAPLPAAVVAGSEPYIVLGAMSGGAALPEPEVFVLADQALNRVVSQIRDEQWEQPIPEWFARSQKDRTPTLREIVGYHAYDDAWVPDMLEGRTMEEAGKDKFVAAELLGDEPKESFGMLVARACAAAREVTDLQPTVHTSFGDFTTQQYFWQVNMFRALRAIDIAKLIGADPRLPDELVQGIWDEVSPQAEVWRQIGVFGPAIPVPDGAPLQDRLLGLTGRDPAAGLSGVSDRGPEAAAR